MVYEEGNESGIAAGRAVRPLRNRRSAYVALQPDNDFQCIAIDMVYPLAALRVRDIPADDLDDDFEVLEGDDAPDSHGEDDILGDRGLDDLIGAGFPPGTSITKRAQKPRAQSLTMCRDDILGERGLHDLNGAGFPPGNLPVYSCWG